LRSSRLCLSLGSAVIFGSDNMVGASDRILDALVEANATASPSYGADPWTIEAERLLAETFEHDLAAFFVATGTAANSLALSAIAQPWNAILCHRHAHIMVDESSAPEFFTGGARLIPVVGAAGKITPNALGRTLERLRADSPHNVRPSAVSVTQASECGLVYLPEEIAELTDVARSHGTALHIDGARFANAVARLNCSPAELTWKVGVDILCLGASKNGALAAEAVVFFDRKRAVDFASRRKRGGHLVAKGRLFGAQFVGWLRDGHWLDLARSANSAADQLSAGLARLTGVRIVWPTEANEVFAILPRSLVEKLRAAGSVFYEWNPDSLPDHESVGKDEVFLRFVTSFLTRTRDVSDFLEVAEATSVPEAGALDRAPGS
jgi:threonine aldolase